MKNNFLILAISSTMALMACDGGGTRNTDENVTTPTGSDEGYQTTPSDQLNDGNTTIPKDTSVYGTTAGTAGTAGSGANTGVTTGTTGITAGTAGTTGSTAGTTGTTATTAGTTAGTTGNTGGTTGSNDGN